MAYTDDQIRKWFKDNPNATDAQIAQIAKDAGVSAAQLSRVTGVSSGEILARANTAGASLYTPEQQTRQAEIDSWVKNSEPVEYQNLYKALQSGQAKVQMVEAPAYTYYSPENGGFVDTGTVKQLGVVDASGKPLQGVSVDPNTGQIRVPTSSGTLYVNTQIDNTGKLAAISPENYNKQVSYQSTGSDWDQLSPIVMMAASAFGAPYLSGLLGGATGLTGAALNAATGATIGGVGSALTGGDPLKGALLGGLGGYASGSLSNALAPTDLGMNSNLTMAQIESGLGTPGYGYGAQAASSGLFNPALIGANAYGSFNPNLDALAADNIDVGGGYNPATGTGDLATAQAAAETGVTSSASIPKAALDFESLPQADYSNEGRNYPTAASTQGAGGSPINSSLAAGGLGLSASQIANLAKAGVGLLGAGAAGKVLGGGLGGGGAIPTQGAPQYSPGYFNAIQQYYNSYMPEMPRDVQTPLQQWYGKQYGA